MQGAIIIPDITGFTRFVKEVDINLGGSITRDLLAEIIDSNPLDLEIAEIEGDAILFYKIGKPIPMKMIFSAVRSMYEAFESKLRYIKVKYGIEAKLSLKFIMHYGRMTIYHLKGFKKLFGQTIIESHRLLKNGSDHSDYILVTDDYMKALHASGRERYLVDWKFSSYTSQVFTDLREISYFFFHYFPISLPHLLYFLFILSSFI